MNLGKLGLNDRILAAVGLLALIDSFLPWYSVSVKAVAVDGFTAGGYSGSTNGWSSGIGAWLPLLILLAIGVIVVLPAFDQQVNLRGGFALLGILALAATIIIILRWLTYPSVPSDGLDGVSAGAGFGTYIGLVLGIVATVFAYLNFVASGGSINTIGAAFSGGPANQAPQQAPGYPPVDQYGQPQQPQAPYQQPYQQPYQPPQQPPQGPPQV